MYLTRARSLHGWGRQSVVIGSVTLALFSALLIGYAPSAHAASSLPQPGSYNQLSGVSCSSSTDCWAVGYAQDMNNNVTGEALHWDGSNWLAVSAPAAAGANLESVSCATSSSCWALGNIGNGQRFPQPLIMRWNGSTWTDASAPSLRQEVLKGISCSSPTNCMAVGTYDRSGRTLALHWDGSTWAQTHTPDPSPKYEESLSTVSCPTAKSCWAFGYYYAAPLKPTVTGYLVALHWDGGAWHRDWTSAPYYGADSSASFGLGIGCASTNDCWTVGYSSLSPLDYHPIIVHLSGGNWAPVKPPSFKNASLDGVSCSSARNCWAVGNTGTFYGGTHSLALHFNGTRWSKITTPRTGHDTLASVACPSAGGCWAVGNIQTGDANAGNLAERWDGSSWKGY